MNKFLGTLVFLFLMGTISQAQVCNGSSRFTWEGDTTGNKAVWKADDVFNSYSVGGVQVNVSLLDPFSVNTTTSNPSEFNDYTKSNAYFGPGALMLQATSTDNNQPICLEFVFSSPVVMEDFRLFDIDFIARGRIESSFQDSLSFYGQMNGRNVPVKLDYLHINPHYTIAGQTAKSKYILNTNGDISHTELRAALKVSSQGAAINKFTICYSNGYEDDGISNSHAVKVVGFDFCEVGLGSISGRVQENGSGAPLAGSTIQLFDTLNQPVLDGFGQPYIAVTGNDGSYSFGLLPFGYYQIVQTQNPPSYFDFNDADGGNDNRIRTLIDFVNPVSINNNFIESSIPLPVSFAGMRAQWLNEDEVMVSWATYAEYNHDYFTILFSTDGIHFDPVGNILSNGQSRAKRDYRFIHEPGEGQVFYYKLVQKDLDGQESELGTVTVKNITSNLTYSILPNPASDFVTLAGLDHDKAVHLSVVNVSGTIIQSIPWSGNTVSIHDLPAGTYFIVIREEERTITLPFQKQ